jgi:hypothetical protein
VFINSYSSVFLNFWSLNQCWITPVTSEAFNFNFISYKHGSNSGNYDSLWSPICKQFREADMGHAIKLISEKVKENETTPTKLTQVYKFTKSTKPLRFSW